MRMLTVALTVWVGLAGLALAQDRAPTLTVTGQGQISVVPDMAVISMGVVHVADTARVGAEVFGLSYEAFAAQTEANFDTLFPKVAAWAN